VILVPVQGKEEKDIKEAGFKNSRISAYLLQY
jgi:hypothetical protein